MSRTVLALTGYHVVNTGQEVGQPNRASSIDEGGDGYRHGRVTVGTKDDGRPDRRHIMSKSKAEVVRRVKALERKRDEGTVQRAGERWTVAQRLEHWLENIARPSVRENTYSGYRMDVHVHLIPAIGAHKFTGSEPEHLERLYVRMRRKGSAAATAHHVHRTVRTALGEAERRGHISRGNAAAGSGATAPSGSRSATTPRSRSRGPDDA